MAGAQAREALALAGADSRRGYFVAT